MIARLIKIKLDEKCDESDNCVGCIKAIVNIKGDELYIKCKRRGLIKTGSFKNYLYQNLQE